MGKYPWVLTKKIKSQAYNILKLLEYLKQQQQQNNKQTTIDMPNLNVVV